jgi:hypothetical protein
MTDELAKFTRDALERSGYRPPGGDVRGLNEPEADEVEPDVAASVEPARDAATDVRDEAAAVVAQKAVTEFWERLSNDEQERLQDPEAMATAFRDYLYASTTPATAEALFNAWRDSGDERDPDGATAPATGADLARQVMSGEIEVEGDPAEWLLWAATAPNAEWTAAAEAANWDSAVRPSQYDLPPDVELERMRRSFAKQLADVRAGRGRRW